jgi:cytochrome c oxidase cbb3-type subunit III
MKNRIEGLSFIRFKFKTGLALFSAVCLPAFLFAQGVELKTGPVNDYSLNPVLITLIALLTVLTFGIGLLGNVLKSLVVVYRDKILKEKGRSKTSIIPGLIIAFMLSAFSLSATEIDSVAVVPESAPVITGLSNPEAYLLLGVLLLELFVSFFLVVFIKRMIRLIENKPELAGSPEMAEALAKVKRIPFWDRFHRAVEIEKEEDILLDHNYDGIRELDNSLPPWWKYGFYLTILISVIYLWYYHGGGNGPSWSDEYAAEVKAGEEAKAAFLAKSAGNVDENTVKMGDASSIAAGQTIFQSSCAACHAKDGGGGVGPNLTDNYWIHGGSVSSVYKSIKYGWVDKGMKSWEDDFSPKQIADITSYVKSLQGSKPLAPKEKQGELYTENTVAPAKDSTAIAIN